VQPDSSPRWKNNFHLHGHNSAHCQPHDPHTDPPQKKAIKRDESELRSETNFVRRRQGQQRAASNLQHAAASVQHAASRVQKVKRLLRQFVNFITHVANGNSLFLPGNMKVGNSFVDKPLYDNVIQGFLSMYIYIKVNFIISS